MDPCVVGKGLASSLRQVRAGGGSPVAPHESVTSAPSAAVASPGGDAITGGTDGGKGGRAWMSRTISKISKKNFEFELKIHASE